MVNSHVIADGLFKDLDYGSVFEAAREFESTFGVPAQSGAERFRHRL